MGQAAIMSDQTLDKLSDMQVACLRLVAELKKTEQIAAELGISPSTVNTHIERAIARLQVPNRREAARLVIGWDKARAAASPSASGAGNDSLDASGRPPSEAELSRPEKIPTEESPLSAIVPAAPVEASSAIGRGRRRNDLTIPQRLLLAVLLLVLICVGLGGLGAAIGKLSDWRAAHGARQ